MKFKKPPQILLKLIFYFSLKKNSSSSKSVQGRGKHFFSQNLQSVIYPRGFSKLQKLILSFIVAYFNENLIFSHTKLLLSVQVMYFFSQSLQNLCNLPIKGRSVHNKKKYKTYVKTFIVAIKNLKTVNIISLKKNFSSWETFTNFSLSLSLSSLCVIYPRGFSTAAQTKKKLMFSFIHCGTIKI